MVRSFSRVLALMLIAGSSRGTVAPDLVRGRREIGTSLGGSGAPLAGFTENITELTGSFIVPPLPTDYSAEQSVFLWFGVEWTGGDYGVLQPVLMFGPDCCAKDGVGPGADPKYSRNPYWYFSSQYVFPNVSSGLYVCDCPDDYQTFRVDVGDVINSTMSFDAVADAWTVYSASSGQESVLLVEHPFNDPSQSWNELQRETTTWGMAVVETYLIDKPEQQMPQDAWITAGVVRPPGKGPNGGLRPLEPPDWAPRPNENCNATCEEGTEFCSFDLTQWQVTVTSSSPTHRRLR